MEIQKPYSGFPLIMVFLSISALDVRILEAHSNLIANIWFVSILSCSQDTYHLSETCIIIECFTIFNQVVCKCIHTDNLCAASRSPSTLQYYKCDFSNNIKLLPLRIYAS